MAVDPTRTPSHFDLLTQPFRLLRIDPAASKRAVSEAFQLAQEAHTASPGEIQAAHDALSDLNTRLFHELTYPLSCSPTETTAFYLALDNDVPLDDALSFAQSLAPLDRANLLAHLASHRPAPGELRTELISAQAAIDVNEVYANLKAARQSAELPPPSLANVHDVLGPVLELHLAAALDGYETVWDAAPAMLDCAIQILSAKDTHRWTRLDVLLDNYQSAIDGPRRDAGGFIERVCALLREHPKDVALQERLRESVHLWTSLCRPLLARQLTSGPDVDFDTPLGAIRELIAFLAQAGESKAALAISDASSVIFAAVPTTMDQLSADARLLSRLAETAQLEELSTAIESAQANLPDIIAALESSGFGERSVGPARALWNAFVQTTKIAEPASRELGWKRMHQFTLSLSNAPQAGKAVIALISGLIVYGEANAAPPALLKEMRNSLKFMQSFVGAVPPQSSRKPAAPPAKPVPRRRRLAEVLLGRIRRMGLLRKKSARPTLRRRLLRPLALGAGGLVAIMLGGAAINLSAHWLRGISSDFTSSAATADPPPLARQTKPPVGTGQRLELDAVRYCHFQKERLRLIKQWIKTPEQARHLNLLVVDYNSRCSDFFYRDDDLRQVQTELEANAPRLEFEAKQLIAGW